MPGIRDRICRLHEDSRKRTVSRGLALRFRSAHEDSAFLKLLRKVFSKAEAVPAKAYPKAKRFTHTLFVAER